MNIRNEYFTQQGHFQLIKSDKNIYNVIKIHLKKQMLFFTF